MSYFVLSLLSFVAAVSAYPSTRIVNGTIAGIGEFPYMVSLRDETGYHLCGGSILNTEWILTAAHCLDGMRPRDLTIQYGVNKISDTNENVVKIREFRIHPDFDEDNTYYADIALLKLKQPIAFNRIVSPVNLPVFKKKISAGEPATVIGWGFNASSNGMLQEKLQKVDYNIVAHDDCINIHYYDVHDNQICAGLPEGGKGQCIGDSGGPLISNGVQVGIVSWSIKPCAVAPYPGVFTEVSVFVDWIVRITGMLQKI